MGGLEALGPCSPLHSGAALLLTAVHAYARPFTCRLAPNWQPFFFVKPFTWVPQLPEIRTDAFARTSSLPTIRERLQSAQRLTKGRKSAGFHPRPGRRSSGSAQSQYTKLGPSEGLLSPSALF